MKNYFLNQALTSLFFTFILITSACNKEDVKPNNEVKFENIMLSGANGVPANNSTATGTFNGTYNKDSNMLTYTVTWTGFTATGMHFHSAPPTASNLSPVEPVPSPLTSPKTATTRALTDAEEADLLAGLWYIDIHSAQFPAGEIRGQLAYNRQ